MATRTSSRTASALHVYSLDDLKDPFAPYSTDNITKKNANKNVLLDLLGKDVESRNLLVGLVLSKKIDKLDEDEKHMLTQLTEALQRLDGAYPVVISLEEDPKLARATGAPSFVYGTHSTSDLALLTGMDAFIFIDKEPRLQDFGHLLVSFGSGIITHKAKILPSFLEEYNQYKERGNALLFAPYDVWNAFAAVVRLKEIASFSYDWNTFRRTAMQSVRS